MVRFWMYFGGRADKIYPGTGEEKSQMAPKIQVCEPGRTETRAFGDPKVSADSELYDQRSLFSFSWQNLPLILKLIIKKQKYIISP